MRFGLIGCGGIGALRAEAISKLPSLKLAVVSDIDHTRAQTIAKRFGGEVAQDWQTLIKQENIDTVIISTPPHLHCEMSIAALKAGKNVLCEKPLARNSEECKRMVEAAQESGRYLATGFNYRFYPSIRKARELFDSGAIGELDHIRSYAGYSATDHSQEWLHDVAIMGGGALRDNGIHLIDLTCYFLGEVAQLKGFASNNVWKYPQCEDNGFLLLQSREGKVASLQASWTEWRGYQMLIELYGTKGCIRAWCFPMWTQLIQRQQGRGRTRRKNYFFPRTFIFEHLYSYRWVVVESFIDEFRAFIRTIHGENTALANGLDGLNSVKIAETALPENRNLLSREKSYG